MRQKYIKLAIHAANIIGEKMKSPNNNETMINYDHGTRIARLETTNENIIKSLDRIENRLDKIENNISSLKKEVNDDFKWTIKTMIGFAILLCGIMAHGFHWF